MSVYGVEVSNKNSSLGFCNLFMWFHSFSLSSFNVYIFYQSFILPYIPSCILSSFRPFIYTPLSFHPLICTFLYLFIIASFHPLIYTFLYPFILSYFHPFIFSYISFFYPFILSYISFIFSSFYPVIYVYI